MEKCLCCSITWESTFLDNIQCEKGYILYNIYTHIHTHIILFTYVYNSILIISNTKSTNRKKDWKKFVQMPIVIIDPFCKEELKHREVRQPATVVTASPRLSTRSRTGIPNPGFSLESLDSLLNPKGWGPPPEANCTGLGPLGTGSFQRSPGRFADHCSRASS